MNFPLILNLAGTILMIVSLFMFIPVGVSALTAQPDLKPLLLAAVLTLVSGGLLKLATRGHSKEEFGHKSTSGVHTQL